MKRMPPSPVQRNDAADVTGAKPATGFTRSSVKRLGAPSGSSKKIQPCQPASTAASSEATTATLSPPGDQAMPATLGRLPDSSAASPPSEGTA